MRFDRDEGPTDEDVRRFGADADGLGWCPDCGAEMSDTAEICPNCRAWLSDGPLREPPVAHGFRRRWLLLVALVTLAAFLGVGSYLF